SLASVLLSIFFFIAYAARRALHSCPTRRSSDLPRARRRRPAAGRRGNSRAGSRGCALRSCGFPRAPRRRRDRSAHPREPAREFPDRKSTRLNSSHVEISYAVFCLKKKKKKKHTI